MKITKELVKEVKTCCHHGHGAAIFEDGSVVFAISSNDVIARGDGRGGWEYRIAYVDDPDVDKEYLELLINYR